MNRRALKTLLRSGRFLCFDARAVYLGLKEGRQPDDPPPDKLFDLSTLNLGIFFKEITIDDEEEVLVATRVYFPYNDAEVDQGGESTAADPDRIVKVLAKRGAIKADESLSAHDQKILDILTSVPTFDPFLLLSQRRELEVERSISSKYFEITEADWMLIRRPVLEKISTLVAKANSGDRLDVYKEFTGEGDDPEAEGRRIMTGAVVDAIWQGEETEGSRSLIRSFRLDETQTKQFLFAWKGINYYEFQYARHKQLFYEFFEWLGSSRSMPRDNDGLSDSAVDRFRFRRDRARHLIRATHATVTRIIRNYNESFDLLIEQDNPIPFQSFLRDAPKNFLTVGLAIGVLAHTANAWDNVTGNKRKALKAVDLEPFYDFIIAINGQDFQAAAA
ncbi:MAG: hypothetical protein RIM33_09510 [Alphaproteobacteria bacterium]